MKTYPQFIKTPAHYYKIVDEHECIQVLINVGSEAIGIYFAGLATQSPDNQECTENDFIRAFNRVSDIIRHKAGVGGLEYSKEEKRLILAGAYLNGEDTSLEEQIALIEAAHKASPESRIYIDNIKGVDLWDNVNCLYTASDFLTIINS